MTHPYASTYTEKQITGICLCINMRYAGFEPAIAGDNVNTFAVYYRHNTSAACHNLSATTLQHAANQYTDVRAAFVPWFRLCTR